MKFSHFEFHEFVQNKALEFLLVSVPIDESPQLTFNEINQLSTKLSLNFKFHVPDLKMLTLDKMVIMEEELNKIDSRIYHLCSKIASFAKEVSLNDKEILKSILRVKGYSTTQYLSKFEWDMAKFTAGQEISSITEIIKKDIKEIDDEFKKKSQSFNIEQTNYIMIQNKHKGNLAVICLTDIVTKEDFVLNSVNLSTALVVVHKINKTNFLSCYESMEKQIVVPGSARLIKFDGEFYLYTVVIFTKNLTDFKEHCRAMRVTLRDYKFSDELWEVEKTEVEDSNRRINVERAEIVNWLSHTFSISYVIYAHIKTIRIFIENMIRYGPNTKCLTVLMMPEKRNLKKLTNILLKHFKNIDSTIPIPTNTKQDHVLMEYEKTYTPITYFRIAVNFLI